MTRLEVSLVGATAPLVTESSMKILINRAVAELLAEYWPLVGALQAEDRPSIHISFYYDESFSTDAVCVSAEVSDAL